MELCLLQFRFLIREKLLKYPYQRQQIPIANKVSWAIFPSQSEYITIILITIADSVIFNQVPENSIEDAINEYLETEFDQDEQCDPNVIDCVGAENERELIAETAGNF